jgi:hypothetical protein
VLTPELLSLYRADSASFCPFLAVFATNFSVARSPLPGITADEAESHALTLLNCRLENSSLPLHEGTILAIALMANLEVCKRALYRYYKFPLFTIADVATRNVTAIAIADLHWLHWYGLQQAIEAKGGIKRIVLSREICATLSWQVKFFWSIVVSISCI